MAVVSGRLRRVVRLVVRCAQLAALLLAAGLLSGVLYETVGAWQDNRVIARVGRSVDIGGRSLNIACAGDGTPTVVFESGRVSPGYVWVPTHREVSKFTRACWYDRAGLGWSDPGPDPNWGDSAARDLHALLERAGVKSPLVLVGHSFGGYIIRLYVEAYPHEAAGLVFVDAAHEDAGTIRGMPYRARPNLPRWLIHAIATGVSYVGFTRFVERGERARPQAWTEQEFDTLTRLRRRRTAGIADAAEGPEVATSSLVRSTHRWEQLPIVVLSQAKMPRNDTPEGESERSVVRDWIALQRELAARSRRGRLVLTDSGHGIPLEDPAAIVSAVRELVDELRGDSR